MCPRCGRPAAASWRKLRSRELRRDVFPELPQVTSAPRWPRRIVRTNVEANAYTVIWVGT